MFKKDLDNVKIKFGSRAILPEALQVYKGLFLIKSFTEIHDKHGVVGYDLGDRILVAKKSTYGDIVSVSEGIWSRTKIQRKKIVMYLQNSRYFYEFDPNKIKEVSYNKRGKTKMVNFDIRNGVNLMKLEAVKERSEEIIKKNKKKLDDEKTRKLCQDLKL